MCYFILFYNKGLSIYAAALLLPLLFKESPRSLHVINEVGSVLPNRYDFIFLVEHKKKK